MAAIPLNESRAREYARSASMAPGKHCLVCVDAARHTKEGNPNLMAKLTFKKMANDAQDDAGKAFDKPLLRKWITIPMGNGDVSGHEPPKWAPSMFAEAIAPFYPEELSEYPKFDRVANVTMYRGEPLAGKDAAEEARAECIVAAARKAAELWGEDGENLGDLRGRRIYGVVSYKEGQDMPELADCHAECPPDWELTEDVEFSPTAPVAVAEKAPAAKLPAKGVSKGKKGK